MRRWVIAFLLGIAILQSQPTLPSALDLGLGGLAWVLLIWLARRMWRVCGMWLQTGMLVALGMGFGILWASLIAHHALRLSLPLAWQGKDLRVVGVVANLPHVQAHASRFQFILEEVPDLPEVEGMRVQLAWYAQEAPVPAIRPGQRWELLLRLQRPHGNANWFGYDYESALLEQGVRATGYVRPESKFQSRLLQEFVPGLNNGVERLRETVRARISQALAGQPYAGVVVALVVGDQRALSQSDWQLFNETGVGHLMSISGLHITMLAALAAQVASFCWRRSFFTRAELPLYLPAQHFSALIGLVVAWGYVLLAGSGVPAQRTLIMLAVVALAIWCKRTTQVSQVLCCALALVLLRDPWALLWPGFWLSFGAVALLLYGGVGRIAGLRKPAQAASSSPEGLPRPIGGFARWRQGLWNTIKSAVRTQYLVTLGLVPLTMLLFGQISLLGPIANAIAIPLISLLVTPLALFGSVLPLEWMQSVLGLAHALIAWLAACLQTMLAAGWSSWQAPRPQVWQFALALAGTLLLLAPRGWPGRYLGLLAWQPMLLNPVLQPAEGEMWVTALDVGQGTAVLVETAHHRLLYDAGPAYASENDAAQRILLPYLRARGIHRLDGLIISHADADHAGGASTILRQMPVAWVLSSLPDLHPALALARQKNIPSLRCVDGQDWTWDGIGLRILHPESASYARTELKDNARSCTLKLQADKYGMLLTGDIEAPQEAQLLARANQALRADVLLVPHHGSGTSSTLPFLQAVQPSVAIFQLGHRNRYQHPKNEVWQRYQDLAIARWRTDRDGGLALRFGARLEIIAYRQTYRRYWQSP